MKKSEAISIIQQAFSGKFNDNSFQVFIANLLKDYTSYDKVREGGYIREAFRQFILKYKIIGYFKDAEGNQIDVLQVYLCKGTSLERARTAQRNFVADYLKKSAQGKRDAALVAFIAPEEQDWRFSLVKLEYSLNMNDGRIITNEDITPAKRWSFRVGKNEGSHTVKSRFVSLLENDELPNLKELEEAFSIEKVTDEFFEKYCELFLRMKESLDGLLSNDPNLKSDFESKEISTVDFAKKTLGQMAFLYFLQKKGWFGVAPNDEWGLGVKNFLRELFSRREKYGKNFFDDVLEPLFYEALAQDRGRDAIYSRLNNCRMPFLNGGLFEPMNGYSWETTHISLPDELFSNSNKTKEGDIGDGILDIFDRYNFTVNENEPLEKEVAVDPEMLGKVFENLLEIRDRKSKGAFYTPREIVHYMCQESLINYLKSETGETIPREDIEFFIQKGVQIIQNDKIVLERNKENDRTYKFLLPESIRKFAGKLDILLANIKVCDPAVGSGAFPLGMLNEIVQARQVLGVHSGSNYSSYDLKLHTISHSIYGVDIDSGAVEIAKLRMWLALVVEEKDPHPLPNLEYKIMQGNSLLSEYEGIKLFDDSLLSSFGSIEKDKEEIQLRMFVLQKEFFELHSKRKLDSVRKKQIETEVRQLQKRLNSLFQPDKPLAKNAGLFDVPEKQRVAQKKMELLQEKIEQFISESRKTQKQGLKEEIDNLKWDLIEATLEEQGRRDKLEEIRILRRKNIRLFFIWKLEFSDVFKEKGGFDVVIGNPPYGAKIPENQKNVLKKEYEYFVQRIPNSFQFFIALQHKLCKKNGVVFNIIPNEFLFQIYMTKARNYLIDNSQFLTAINLGDNVFNAVVPTCIIGFKNIINKGGYPISVVDLRHTTLENLPKSLATKNFPKINSKTIQEFPNSIFSFDVQKSKLMSKLEKYDKLEKFCEDIANGISTSCDDVYVVPYDFAKKLNFENEHVFECIKGGDINKYFLPRLSKNVILYITKDFELEKNPNIKNYLEANKEKLIKKSVEKNNGSRRWDILFRSRSKELFNVPKLLFRQTGDSIVSTIDSEKKIYCIDSINLAPLKLDYQGYSKYLLGIINSKLLNFYYREISQEGGRILAQVKPQRLKALPILLDKNFKAKIESIVDQILTITSAPDYDPKKPPIRQKELETMIDEMVFDLYELTPEERAIVLKS